MILLPSERWLTPHQAAESLPGGGHPAKVVRWFTEGLIVDGRRLKLAATRVGGRWFVRTADLEAFLAAVGAARGGQGIPAAAVAVGVSRIATREALRRHRQAKRELVAAGVLDAEAVSP
jgi:hypothetical protein